MYRLEDPGTADSEVTVFKVASDKMADIDADNFMGEIVVSEPGSEEEEEYKFNEKEETKKQPVVVENFLAPGDGNDSVVIRRGSALAGGPESKLLIDSQHISINKLEFLKDRPDKGKLPKSYIVWRDPATLLVSQYIPNEDNAQDFAETGGIAPQARHKVSLTQFNHKRDGALLELFESEYFDEHKLIQYLHT